MTHILRSFFQQRRLKPWSIHITGTIFLNVIIFFPCSEETQYTSLILETT